jgi:hypothetical protein
MQRIMARARWGSGLLLPTHLLGLEEIRSKIFWPPDFMYLLGISNAVAEIKRGNIKGNGEIPEDESD